MKEETKKQLKEARSLVAEAATIIQKAELIEPNSKLRAVYRGMMREWKILYYMTR